MRRRDFLAAAAAAGAYTATGARAQSPQPIVRKGNIRQGLWRVNFGQAPGAGGEPMTLEEQCAVAQRLGVVGFDLVQFSDAELLDRYGLKILLVGPGSMDFLTGIVHPEAHDIAEASLKAQGDGCAQTGCRNIAVNAGQLRGLSYAQAQDNAVELCKRVGDYLAERNCRIVIENVNDRRPGEPNLGREDMAFGHWDWGMEVVERVDSPGVMLLCDLYHLQIMDGDLARHLRDDIGRIGHIHVAGVPTRTEIDDTQEINFRYLAQVIAGLDYDGYVSHEWRPSPGADPLESLARAVDLMDV